MTPLSTLLAFALTLAICYAQSNVRTYVDCACSASNRGFTVAARDELRADLLELTQLRNELLIERNSDPSITAATIEQRLKVQAGEDFAGCVNNYSHEECINADASLRHRAGNYRTTFCSYNRATWNSGGKPSCDKTPRFASRDADIIAGRPEVPSSKPVLTTPKPQASPAKTPPSPAPKPGPPAEQPAPPTQQPTTPGAPPAKPSGQPATAPPTQPDQKPPADDVAKQPQTPDDAALPIPARKTPSPGASPANESLEEEVLQDQSSAEETPPARETRPPCFPRGALVSLEDGSAKRMDQLVVGDRVAVGNGKYSEVFMFTHKLADVQHDFVAISTASGASLRLTSGHYLPINGVYKAAREANIGDSVHLADGTSSKIVEVSTVVDTGLFNPQTSHGDIIVDGVRASTYTTAIEPKMAHALLAPLRLVCERLRLHVTFLDSGADNLGRFSSLLA